MLYISNSNQDVKLTIIVVKSIIKVSQVVSRMSLLNKLFVYSEYELRTRRHSLSLGNSVFVEHPNIFCRTHKIFSVHMMTQGAAQQSGRQMGMTAAPPFSPLSSLDLAPLSAAYEALKYCPWALSSASRAFTSSLFLVYRSPDISHHLASAHFFPEDFVLP